MTANNTIPLIRERMRPIINGKQLKALRTSAGLTQSQLAEQLGGGGYNNCAVSAYENGKRIIGLNLLRDWAAACGYSLEVSFKPNK